MYILKQGFREGVAGLIIAILGMFYVFLKYAKLWELRLNKRKKATEDDVSAPKSMHTAEDKSGTEST
jgi:hypothetical protein